MHSRAIRIKYIKPVCHRTLLCRSEYCPKDSKSYLIDDSVVQFLCAQPTFDDETDELIDGQYNEGDEDCWRYLF